MRDDTLVVILVGREMASRPPPIPQYAAPKKSAGCLKTFLVFVAGMFVGSMLTIGSKSEEPPRSKTPVSAHEERAPQPSSPEAPVAPLVSQPVPATSQEKSKPERPANDLEGKVVSVADGDTITILTASKQQVKVRLEGIDAPEDSQEYGHASKQALAGYVAGKTVSIRTTGQDRYGRTLGWVHVDGEDMNRRMVAEGWAWHYTKYNTEADIAKLQKNAQALKLGLWKAPNEPMPPWDYRSLQVNPAVPDPKPAPAPTPPQQIQTDGSSGGSSRGFPQPPAEAKANPSAKNYWINSNGVRHNSGCRWFGKTKRGHYGGKDEGRACGICGG